MAAFNATQKATCHTRSISLPSRTHPLTVSAEEQLYRLKASEATSSSSSTSICNKLGGLKELYERVDDLLQLPLTQQALSHARHEKWVEELLDGSLRLLDVCGTIRDVFSPMKECVQELESTLRRRRGGDSGLANEIGTFITSRKKLNKLICKCLGNLKRMEKKSTSMLLYKDSNLAVVINLLREVEEISLTVFASLLSSISQPMARSKPSGWSLVSKLLQSKRVSCEGEAHISEVEKIDVELLVLNSKKSSKDINLLRVQKLQKQLEALELSIQVLEEGLECVYRHLVKTRVSLLNILNH